MASSQLRPEAPSVTARNQKARSRLEVAKLPDQGFIYRDFAVPGRVVSTVGPTPWRAQTLKLGFLARPGSVRGLSPPRSRRFRPPMAFVLTRDVTWNAHPPFGIRHRAL